VFSALILSSGATVFFIKRQGRVTFRFFFLHLSSKNIFIFDDFLIFNYLLFIFIILREELLFECKSTYSASDSCCFLNFSKKQEI